MPELVSLTVFNFEGNDLVSDHQLSDHPAQISLPKLKVLTLQGDLRNAGTILQCLTPSPDCAVSATWMGMPIPGIDSESDYEHYEKGIISFIVPYFSLHPPSAIELCFPLDRDILSLESLPSTTSSGLDHPPRFSIELYPYHLHSSSLVKELINSGSFSRVTTLHMPIYIMRTTPGAALDLIYVLEAFSSLTTLSTTDITLQPLLQYPDRMSTLFPVLVTLEVTSRGQREWVGWKSDVPPHERFLNLRREIGRSIAVLDLGYILELHRDRDHLD
ncbi:hypothetical protein CPC08DRAFT_765482 [Agrocybe pediades]|nr:hypothetical protein CPC08DRAFT_765482 [Agrocybe pediades]